MRKISNALILILLVCISLAGCKADSQQAAATGETIITPDETPTPSPTEPPILASDLLEKMKASLDEVESYSINEYFELEFTGEMNDAFARTSSELEYMRTDTGFKALGNERTDRDAGSIDKVTQYKLYVETSTENTILLQTLADGTWDKSLLEAEGRDALDHINKYYAIANNSESAEYIGMEDVDGVQAHVIEYTLSYENVRSCLDRLEKFSVPVQVLGEDTINLICSETEMKATVYLREDGDSMLPIKIALDYTPLQQAMLDKLDVEIEIVKAFGESIIGNYNEVADVELPGSAQTAYDKPVE